MELHTTGTRCIDTYSYPDNCVKVSLQEPVIAAIAPRDSRTARWGMFQFPRLWKHYNSSRIFLQIHYGLDTQGRVGTQLPSLYYYSDDDGAAWEQIEEQDVDTAPEAVETGNGGRVRIGPCHEHMQQAEVLIPSRITDVLDISDLDLSPRGSCYSPNGCSKIAFYRYGDIPVERRAFEISYFNPPSELWAASTGIIDMPDLLLQVVMEGKSDDRWYPVSPKMVRPKPRSVVSDKKGTLFGLIDGQAEGTTDFFQELYCIVSEDDGRTWRYRGTAANDSEKCRFGFGGKENDMVITDSGELVVLMRTDKATITEGDTKAAMLTRSTDCGFSWSPPEPVAPFSVTPQLIQLANGISGLVCGRPGVHLLFSHDDMHTWHTPRTLIGRSSSELAAIRKELEGSFYANIFRNDTCANTSHVVLGPDRFLLAYSDFNFYDKDNYQRKLIKVQEISVSC